MTSNDEPLLNRQNSRLAQGTLKKQTSHFFVPEHESSTALQGIAEANVKNAFIKKVYGLLAVEILWTALIVCFFMFNEGVQAFAISFVAQHFVIYQVLMLVSMFSSLCALYCKKNVYPLNMYFLFLFITVMSIQMGIVAALYAASGRSVIVLEAFVITTAIFFTLSAYAHISKTDFSFLYGFLFAALMANICLGLFTIFLGNFDALHYVYCVFGILIFCGYILYDTNQIIHKMGCDDYLIASVELYLDFLNLMLAVLEVLGSR